jgi:nucleoside-diphosphate-sugar epimerase
MRLTNRESPDFSRGECQRRSGWKGDVKNMLLDISKLKALGWKPKLDSKQAVREAAKSLIKEGSSS